MDRAAAEEQARRGLSALSVKAVEALDRVLQRRRQADEADNTKKRNVAERALAAAIHQFVTIVETEHSIATSSRP